ncbi:MAG: RecX family transcriptional regulator [Eubacteriales bacterium]|nr:RecX family transcriptional regulator [Eubacteriales bacterium]
MNALKRAVSYLNIKPRTKSQVEAYLREKNFEDSEISEAIKELEEYHYLDDLEFSRLYFELGFEKGHGINRIRRELVEKGVDSNTIDEAFALLENVPDAFEMALKIAKRTVETCQIPEDYQQKQKLMSKIVRKLTARGFSVEVAYKVAKELIK